VAMTEVKMSSTAENIKNYVIDTLKKYEMSLKHCKGWTTDNGSNYIKTGKILETLQELGEEEDDVDYKSIEYIESPSFLKAMANSSHKFIDKLKCWPHTLQLAVQTYLEHSTLSYLLEVSDKAAKALRTPTMRKQIDEKNLNHAKLRNKTRWGSTFDEIQSLIKLRSLCRDFEDAIPELKITPADWDRLQSLLNVLSPVKNLTVRLQCEQLVAGQAFAYLKSCLVSIEEIQNEFSGTFLPILRKRANSLFKEPSVLASAFFDPRFACLLDSEEQEIAIEYILALKRYMEVEIGSDQETNENQEAGCSNKSFEINQNETGDSRSLDDILDGLINQSKENIEETPTGSFDLKILLTKFSRIHLPKNSDIFFYWENIKSSQENEFFSLYELATVCLALPVTQVSVERCFSTLKFVLNDLID
jgi:hypothetical protein